MLNLYIHCAKKGGHLLNTWNCYSASAFLILQVFCVSFQNSLMQEEKKNLEEIQFELQREGAKEEFKIRKRIASNKEKNFVGVFFVFVFLRKKNPHILYLTDCLSALSYGINTCLPLRILEIVRLQEFVFLLSPLLNKEDETK